MGILEDDDAERNCAARMGSGAAGGSGVMRGTWGEPKRSGGPWLPLDWQSIPFTRGLLITMAVVFLAYFFTGQDSGPIAEIFLFRSDQWLHRPWTWFTYALLEMPSLWVIFTVLVLYQIGGSLERSWGSLNYGVLFFAFAGIGALAFIPALYILGKPVMLAGATIPLVSIVAAWAAIDPELEMCFWGIPTRAKLIAALWVGLTYFQFGLGHRDPVLALCVLVAPAAAWFYVRKFPRLNLSIPRMGRSNPRSARSRPSGPPPDLLREEVPDRERATGFNPLKKRREQMEIERLKRLLGEDDDDRPAPRGR